MRIFRFAFLSGLSAVILPSAWAAETETVKQDLARLQGEWSMVCGAADGQPMPTHMVKQMKRVCQGDEVTTTMGEALFFKARITLDPSKLPKTIDYEMIEGATRGQKQLGIYSVEKDRFRACFGKPGAERPTDFTSKPGDGRTWSVWKFEKPAAPVPGPK